MDNRKIDFNPNVGKFEDDGDFKVENLVSDLEFELNKLSEIFKKRRRKLKPAIITFLRE